MSVVYLIAPTAFFFAGMFVKHWFGVRPLRREVAFWKERATDEYEQRMKLFSALHPDQVVAVSMQRNPTRVVLS